MATLLIDCYGNKIIDKEATGECSKMNYTSVSGTNDVKRKLVLTEKKEIIKVNNKNGKLKLKIDATKNAKPSIKLNIIRTRNSL